MGSRGERRAEELGRNTVSGALGQKSNNGNNNRSLDYIRIT